MNQMLHAFLLLAIACVGVVATPPQPPSAENNHQQQQEKVLASRLLRIAVIASLHESVPPRTEYDLAETRAGLHVADLVKGLVSRGHQVTVFASHDSDIKKAKLISDPYFGAIRWNWGRPGFFNHSYVWMLQQVLKRVKYFDVLHFHTIEHFAHIGPFMAKTLTTLHEQPGGGTVAQLGPLAELFPDAPVATTSEEHFAEAAPYWKNLMSVDVGGSPRDMAAEYEKLYAKVLSGELNVFQEPPKPKDVKPHCVLHDGPLRIALVSPPIFDLLPPKLAGGTERMVYFLTEELQKRGHHVTLFAPAGSETSATLFPIPYGTNPWAGKGNWIEHIMPWIFSQELVKRNADKFDILHFHDPSHFVLMRDFLDRGMITRHMPIDDIVFFLSFSHIPMVAISDQMIEMVPRGMMMNWIGTVHNGIALKEFAFHAESTAQTPYLAWMGRMAPEKGIDIAIQFAVKAGIRLKIAAQLNAEHKKWWVGVAKPLIKKNAHLVEFLGEIGGKERNEFLGNALAFLFTPKWDEPFGLAMIEAMATGTPVIANRRGAVPEIVEDGVSGFMFDYDMRFKSFKFNAPGDDKASLSNKTGLDQQQTTLTVDEVVAKVKQIRRADVREFVENRWSLAEMAKNYERVYRKKLANNCQ